MLLYKISRTFFDRFEEEFIIIYNKRDKVLDIILDLLILY